MRYVIIRDDDTNALTPAVCLERLYRPFLDRGLPVNLAAIPDVTTHARMADGRPEGFLLNHDQTEARTLPLGSNQHLVRYLRENPGYKILQHGCHHDYHEFERADRREAAQLLEQGTQRLIEAGLPRPETFVAPYDMLSRAGLAEVAARFPVLSTGWYELRRLPYAWWPRYALKKLRQAPHWRVNGTLLLSHPGCLLSCQHTCSTMLENIRQYLDTQRLTVLVTHWWEYFPSTGPDAAFIDTLHETADYLATQPQVKVISFSDLLNQPIPLN